MSTAIRRAIYGKLAGDTTLTGLLPAAPTGYSKNIFHQQGPEGAQFPMVIFQKSAGTPTYTFQTGQSAYESDVWLIKAVGRGDTADPAEAIQARLVSLLTDATLSISGASLMYLRRDSDVEYPEVTDGVTYQHVGSLWRLMYQ